MGAFARVSRGLGNKARSQYRCWQGKHPDAKDGDNCAEHLSEWRYGDHIPIADGRQRDDSPPERFRDGGSVEASDKRVHRMSDEDVRTGFTGKRVVPNGADRCKPNMLRRELDHEIYGYIIEARSTA